MKTIIQGIGVIGMCLFGAGIAGNGDLNVATPIWAIVGLVVCTGIAIWTVWEGK